MNKQEEREILVRIEDALLSKGVFCSFDPEVNDLVIVPLRDGRRFAVKIEELDAVR